MYECVVYLGHESDASGGPEVRESLSSERAWRAPAPHTHLCVAVLPLPHTLHTPGKGSDFLGEEWPFPSSRF